jgi:hypothetical protein
MKAMMVLSLGLAGLGLAMPSVSEEAGLQTRDSRCIAACKVKQAACRKGGIPCLKDYERCKCTCKGKKYDERKVGQGDKACY